LSLGSTLSFLSLEFKKLPHFQSIWAGMGINRKISLWLGICFNVSTPICLSEGIKIEFVYIIKRRWLNSSSAQAFYNGILLLWFGDFFYQTWSFEVFWNGDFISIVDFFINYFGLFLLLFFNFLGFLWV